MTHVPVLLPEVIEFLQLEKGQIILDATIGGGGHSKEILKKIVPGGKLIGLDRDVEAIERVGEKLRSFRDSMTLIKSDFREIKDVFDVVGLEKINGAVFDLGISSFQLDDGSRGFSFREDGPLDMRYDTSQEISAFEIVNRSSARELEEIIKEYGEERHARLVAKNICSSRKRKKIETTGELKKIIKDAIGSKYYKQKLDPSTRTFQALRISTNDELRSVEKGVADVIDHLSTGSRVCVISFHSLEDRIVKNIFRDKKREGEINIITKKPITPSREEVRENSRSRSAKLRVGEKT